MDLTRKKTVAIETLGCKLNQAESEHLAREITRTGYKVVDPSGRPDVYILNSCTVTGMADRQARQLLRRRKKDCPESIIIVTGCYAERAPEELGRVEGVKYILGNKGKDGLVALLSGLAPFSIQDDNASGTAVSRRTRAFVRVQDGCDKGCTYCIVPRVRGGKKSRPLTEIVNEVKELQHGGYREIVLTGTEIGEYGAQGSDLSGLIERLLLETNITRFRLSSLQPQELTPDLVSLWQNPRLCRHFHLSLQSGSAGVLLRMRRQYTPEEYIRAVSELRVKIPGVAITTDVMAGFPGETDGEFRESYNFCARAAFARIHVFAFSPRPGTAAALMPNQVDDKIKKERSRNLLNLARDSLTRFTGSFLGQTISVLWEQGGDAGVWNGLTDNYLRVYTRNPEDLTNRLSEVRLEKTYRDGLWGYVVIPP